MMSRRMVSGLCLSAQRLVEIRGDPRRELTSPAEPRITTPPRAGPVASASVRSSSHPVWAILGEAFMFTRAYSLALLLFAAIVLAPGIVLAQSSIAGVVKDTSGAVLPGVTVEASSDVLIEKVRSAVTD